MSMIQLHRRVLGVAGLAAALSLLGPGCATNPATGKSQFVLITEQQEIAMGRQADEEITASMGLYDDPEMQAYVQRLGAELAANSERPELDWSFKVIDDPIVNAFALPGGYIYVTRGIMTHLNSEAELVGVLGHEIGHVTARHSVSRLSKAQVATIGLGVGMILSPELASFGDVAQMGLGLLFLKFSRDDERQADELGVRYAVSGGYDAREMPEVFRTLQRVGEAARARGLPNWLATHPDPENRAERVAEMAAAPEIDYTGAKIDRPGYLGRLEGMVFGDDPRQGFFEGTAFYHPELEFQMVFPEGWTTTNQRHAVTAISPEKDAAFELTLAKEDDPGAAAEAFFGQQGLNAGRRERGDVNGLSAVAGGFTADTQQGRLAGNAVFIAYGGNVYRLLGYAPESKWNARSGAVAAAQRSFARLTDSRKLSVRPARVELVRLGGAMTLEEFDRRYPSTVDLETIALINHVEPGHRFARGDQVKRVVGGIDQRGG